MLLLLGLFLKHKHEVQANSLPLVKRHGTLCDSNKGHQSPVRAVHSTEALDYIRSFLLL